MAARPRGTDLVRLNVGGVQYETSLMTLQGGGGQTYFSALFGETGDAMRAPPQRKRSRRDGAGGSAAAPPDSDEDEDDASPRPPPPPLFIDRNGQLFAAVLEYLRTGSLPAAIQDDRAALVDLGKEAAFYMIDPLTRHIAERLRILGSALHSFWGVKLPSAQGSAGGTVVTVDVPEGREITITRVVRQPNGSSVGKGFRQFVYLSADGVERVCIAALSGAGPSGGGADEASAATAPLAAAGGVQQVNLDIRLRSTFQLVNEARGVVMHVIGYMGPPTMANAPQPPRGSLLY